VWCACTDGWFSIVKDIQEPGRMLIRARCENDINNLFTKYAKACPSMRKPTADNARDYRYRLSISKPDWVKLAGLLAESVEYPNFKSAVHQRADQQNKDAAYMEIWALMREVQYTEAETT
jgi:hypothetical protein